MLLQKLFMLLKVNQSEPKIKYDYTHFFLFKDIVGIFTITWCGVFFFFFYGMFSDEAFCQKALSLIHIRDLRRDSLWARRLPSAWLDPLDLWPFTIPAFWQKRLHPTKLSARKRCVGFCQKATWQGVFKANVFQPRQTGIGPAHRHPLSQLWLLGKSWPSAPGSQVLGSHVTRVHTGSRWGINRSNSGLSHWLIFWGGTCFFFVPSSFVSSSYFSSSFSDLFPPRQVKKHKNNANKQNFWAKKMIVF